MWMIQELLQGLIMEVVVNRRIVPALTTPGSPNILYVHIVNSPSCSFLFSFLKYGWFTICVSFRYTAKWFSYTHGCVCVCVCVCVSCSVTSNSLQPHRLHPPGSSVHGDSLGKNTGVGCHLGSSQTRNQTQVSCIAGRFFIVWATREAEELMLKLKLQYFGHLMWRATSLEQTLMLRKIEGRRRRGWQMMRWLDGITNSMALSLSKLRGDDEGQGSLAYCSPWGCKESDTTWATEKQQHMSPFVLFSMRVYPISKSLLIEVERTSTARGWGSVILSPGLGSLGQPSCPLKTWQQ